MFKLKAQIQSLRITAAPCSAQPAVYSFPGMLPRNLSRQLLQINADLSTHKQRNEKADSGFDHSCCCVHKFSKPSLQACFFPSKARPRAKHKASHSIWQSAALSSEAASPAVGRGYVSGCGALAACSDALLFLECLCWPNFLCRRNT